MEGVEVGAHGGQAPYSLYPPLPQLPQWSLNGSCEPTGSRIVFKMGQEVVGKKQLLAPLGRGGEPAGHGRCPCLGTKCCLSCDSVSRLARLNMNSKQMVSQGQARDPGPWTAIPTVSIAPCPCPAPAPPHQLSYTSRYGSLLPQEAKQPGTGLNRAGPVRLIPARSAAPLSLRGNRDTLQRPHPAILVCPNPPTQAACGSEGRAKSTCT